MPNQFFLVSSLINICVILNQIFFNEKNYDNDNVCNELEIEGCTSSGACNYFSLATDDDGTCEFPETFYNCEGVCLNDQDNDGLCCWTF